MINNEDKMEDNNSTPVPEQAESAPVEQTEEVVEETEQAPEPTKEEIKALKKKFDLKVNNKTKSVELDLNNDSEIQKYLEKALGADEKFQEAASIRKQMEGLINELKTNPIALLKHPELGIDLMKLAEEVMSQELEELQLTPEQKRIRELESALKEREEKEKKAQEERDAMNKAKLEQEAAISLNEDIIDALQNSTLPKSPFVVRRIVDTLLSAMEEGHTDVKVKDIIPFVEQTILGDLNQLFESAPDDTFDKVMESVIGKKNLDKYRKKQVTKVKSAPKPVIKQNNAAPVKQEPTKDAPIKKFKDVFGNF